MTSTIKVAVVQAPSVIFNKKQTLERVRQYSAEAHQNGAELVLFPEAFVSGYPRGCTFGCTIGARSEDGRTTYAQYFESSVDIPGADLDELCDIARSNNINLICGVMERESGSLYCAIVYIDNKGTFLGRHRKLKPTAAERIVWGEGDKDTSLKCVKFPLRNGSGTVTVGGLICWENYMPEARLALYKQHVQIYVAPTADSRDLWQSTMKHIAREGACFVLGCNQFVTRDMYPKDVVDREPALQGGSPSDVLCRGGSVVVSPFGEALTGPLFGQSGVLYSDLDLSSIVKAKMDFDVVGHYSFHP